MKTSTDLARLPKKPSDDPRSEISALLHKFTSDLGRHVEGLPQVIGTFESTGDEGLIQSVNAAQQLFRITIRSTAPNFQPFEKKDAQSKHLSLPYFLRSEEGDQCEDEGSSSEDEDHNGLSASRSPQPKVYIDEVLEAAQRYAFQSSILSLWSNFCSSARTRELPGHYPFVVQREFIRATVDEKWQGPAMILCRAVHKLVLNHVQKLVSNHFSFFGQGYLETRVQ